MKRNMGLFINDILENIGLIEGSIQKISEEGFKQNKLLIDATLRRLEIIGEAAKNIPQSFKEKYSNQSGFKIIPRDNSEMIELYKEGENVRVYFSSPELIKSLSLLN